MSDHPPRTGTLTFLFTDVERSTGLVQELGERWNRLLEEHQRLLRSAFAEHGGLEVGTAGDSFFVAFDTAPRAVAARSCRVNPGLSIDDHVWVSNYPKNSVTRTVAWNAEVLATRR